MRAGGRQQGRQHGRRQGDGNRSGIAGTQADGVEVLSFHAKRRCATCVAIEKLTREVVAENFAPQVADGKLRLRVIDISEDEASAERYEVTWSSLLLCRRDGGSEQVNDLTRFAFAKARTAPTSSSSG